jgi:hypothetical protein
MRVPDRLSLIDDVHNGFEERPSAKKDSPSDFHRMMTVPDRILVPIRVAR